MKCTQFFVMKRKLRSYFVYIFNVEKKIPGLELKINVENDRNCFLKLNKSADRKISLRKNFHLNIKPM